MIWWGEQLALYTTTSCTTWHMCETSNVLRSAYELLHRNPSHHPIRFPLHLQHQAMRKTKQKLLITNYIPFLIAKLVAVAELQDSSFCLVSLFGIHHVLGKYFYKVTGQISFKFNQCLSMVNTQSQYFLNLSPNFHFQMFQFFFPNFH